MKDTLEFLGFGILVTGILCGFLVPVLWGAHLYESYRCEVYGELTDLETKVIALDTCMVNDPDLGWVTYDERKMSRAGEKVFSE